MAGSGINVHQLFDGGKIGFLFGLGFFQQLGGQIRSKRGTG